MSRPRFALLLLVLLAACPPAPAVLDAGGPLDAGGDAGVGPVDAGPEPLRFTLRADTTDAGTVALDAFDAGGPLEPVTALELAFSAPLDDVRIRVMDWTDAVVESDDVATEADGGFTYRITFAQPLKSGRAYALLIDAETKEALVDAHGALIDQLRVPLQISGAPTPEPGKPGKKPKRKKR